MEQELDQVKKAVAGYKPEQPGNHLRILRSMLSAINSCLKYVRENAQTDRGCSQRLVRELDEILAGFPIFRGLSIDAKAANRLHTRRLADEHLEFIRKHLQDKVKEEEAGKEKLIHEWAETHPVFQELKKLEDKRLPKTAYILLFSQENDGELELVTQSSKDGKIYTRFRPHEFTNDLKLHKTFQRASIVGAAVIVERDLHSTIGTVPQPEENSPDSAQHLKSLLQLSNSAASQPAKIFLESNLVLKELHELSRQKEIAKDAYILLFQNGEGEDNPNLEIVVRKSSEGKIISRFWSSDFAINHKVFDAFRNKPAIVGAAIIKKDELLRLIGVLPQPQEEESQLDVLLKVSMTAFQRPLMEFLEGNEVLKGLHEFANSETRPKEAEVILFALEGSRLNVIPMPGRGGRSQSRTPLNDFQSAQFVHERFADIGAIAGASVISDSSESSHKRPQHDDRKFERSKHGRQVTAERPVVVAAFGKTPLKVNLLATTDTLRRLGINA